MSCDVVTVDNCSTRHGTTVTTHDNTNLIDVPQNVLHVVCVIVFRKELHLESCAGLSLAVHFSLNIARSSGDMGLRVVAECWLRSGDGW